MFMFFRKYIGTRKFYMTVLAVALPLMFQQLITSSVNLVDNLMIGQLGDEALSGVAAVNRYYMVSLFGINGLMAATTVFIAQFFGAKNTGKMKETFRIAIIGGYIVAIPFFLLGTFGAHHVLNFFISSGDALTISYGIQYLHVIAWTFIPLALSLAIGQSMRSIGDVKTPLYAAISAVLINVCFNYILIFGHFGFPRLGVVGAALATLLARVVEMLVLLLLLKIRSYEFKTKISEMFKFSKQMAFTIIKKGAPLVVNEIFWGTGMSLLFVFYGTRGVEVSSGYAIAGTTADLFFTLFAGMAVATTVLVSQPLGADQKEEAQKNGYQLILFSMMMALVFGILIFLSSFIVPQFYSEVSPQAKEISTTFLRIMGCLFFIYMANAECYFILRAGGDMKSTLFMDAGFMWCINLPLVALVTYFTDWPIYYIYITGQVTDLLKLVVSLWMVKKEKWVKNLTHLDTI